MRREEERRRAEHEQVTRREQDDRFRRGFLCLYSEIFLVNTCIFLPLESKLLNC